MYAHVNGVRLFYDVDGAHLVADGPTMRERPTLLLLHGGPGFDHSIYKPDFGALRDVAQVVYLDHRGNGRSDRSDPEHWNLAQWGDDVAAFCDVVGIVNPIVFGSSFGGMVAIAYATRHPSHPAKLVLVSSEAKGYSHLERRVELFEQLGGAELGALARRRFIEGDTSLEVLEAWIKLAFPLYTRSPADPDVLARGIRSAEVTAAFTRAGGEQRTFDYLADLAAIECPTLVLGGELDPMVPIEAQRELVRALPQHLVEFRSFPNAGHGVVPDATEEAFAEIRRFISRPA